MLYLILGLGAALLVLHKSSAAAPPTGIVPSHPLTGGFVNQQLLPAGTSVGFGLGKSGGGGQEFVADGKGGIYRKSDGAVPESGKLLVFAGHTYQWTQGANGVWVSVIQPDDISQTVSPDREALLRATFGTDTTPSKQASTFQAPPASGFGTSSLAATGRAVVDSQGFSAEQRLGMLGLGAAGLVPTDGSTSSPVARTVPTTNGSPIFNTGSPSLF